MRVVSAVCLSIVCIASAGLSLVAQTPAGRTVWSGVYSDAQAARGETEYVSRCAGCHRDDLSGYQSLLKGDRFMDTSGVLTGVLVTQHHEPYGDFSVDPPQFAAQFKGKSIRDPFKVGADVDAVSRATISITSATRAIRNSARRVATRLLAPPK